MDQLSGGRQGIYKQGERVFRPLKSWTKHVHDYLTFLHQAGFDKVPQALACETADVVSFVEGDVYNGLLPEEIRSEKVLRDVAKLIRSIHDLGADYLKALKGDEPWMLPCVSPLETMCHGDLAPYNMVFSKDVIQGIIDFDTLHPGPRLWDLAYAAYRWVPLMSEDNPEDFKPEERRARLKAFLEAYGMPYEAKELLDWALIRLKTLMAYMRTQAALGNPEMIHACNQGHLQTYEKDIKAIEAIRKAMI